MSEHDRGRDEQPVPEKPPVPETQPVPGTQTIAATEPSAAAERPTPDEPTNPDGTPRSPSRWVRRWDRVSTIYRTRVRTTTVLLLAVWIACLVLYMLSANHYGTLPTTSEPEPRPETTQEWQAPVETTPEEPVRTTDVETPQTSGLEGPETSTPESEIREQGESRPDQPGTTVTPTGSQVPPTTTR